MSDKKKIPGDGSFDREFEWFLESSSSRLSELYRKLPQAEPDAQLDAAVRALAQRATTATTRKQIAAHRRWLPVFGVAAVVALAVGFAFRLGPQLWQRPAAVAPAEAVVAPTPPANRTAPAAGSAPAALASPEPAAESSAPAPAAKAATHNLQKVENAPSRPAPRAFPAPARAMREAPPPPAAAEAEPMSPAPEMAAPVHTEQTDAQSAGAPVQSLAAPAADRNATLYPEHWLANIRRMLRDNQREAALRSLDEFRKKYPDYSLPDDLRNLH